MTTPDRDTLRERLTHAVVTAPIDWEGRRTSTWDRGMSVVDAVLAALPPPPTVDTVAEALHSVNPQAHRWDWGRTRCATCYAGAEAVVAAITDSGGVQDECVSRTREDESDE
jgi:hypothetical protein